MFCRSSSSSCVIRDLGGEEHDFSAAMFGEVSEVRSDGNFANAEKSEAAATDSIIIIDEEEEEEEDKLQRAGEDFFMAAAAAAAEVESIN